MEPATAREGGAIAIYHRCPCVHRRTGVFVAALIRLCVAMVALMTPQQRARLNQMWWELGCDPMSDDCGRIESLITLATLDDIRQGFERLKTDFEKTQSLATQTQFDFSR